MARTSSFQSKSAEDAESAASLLKSLGKPRILVWFCSGRPASPLSAEETLQRFLRGAFPGAFRLVTLGRLGVYFTRKLKIERVLGRLIPSCSTCRVLEQPCPTAPPFPQFFSPLLGRRGFLLDRPPARASAGNAASATYFATENDNLGANQC